MAVRTKTPLQQLLPCETEDLETITEELLHIRSKILQLEAQFGQLDSIHPKHLKSARNLLHYLALRSLDVRQLQINLSEWGLSSLGRSERKVQAVLDTILHVTHQLVGKKWKPAEMPPACYREGWRILEENTTALLGDPPSGRGVRIMVTMPSEAAINYRLVYDLLEGGMNCARINCAHDSPDAWERMVANIRKAESATGRRCKILMDLAGPKLRTGPLNPGPQVVKVRPKRDALGVVVNPAMIWFFSERENMEPQLPASVVLQVPGNWLKQITPDDRIVLLDARGARRKLKVVAVEEKGVWTSANKTIYFTPKTKLELKPKKKKAKNKTAHPLNSIPHKEASIRLFKDDLLVISKKPGPGREAEQDESGALINPPMIGCTIQEVLDDVQIGEPVWFDDGKIGGIIERIEPQRVLVRIHHARPEGERLRSEKGINLPESDLQLPALTREDLQHLEFVVQHADMVGLSFANTPQDVDELIGHLKQLKPENPPGIVLKVETRRGFDNLPLMILSAKQIEVSGVMIARGDLAIECGFSRLAEVQEQILWICEAAHTPAIWATQVLEGLAKQGLPSRAEVTDAAMGQRAECIMLNKGEHIVEATIALDDILRRMQDHQTKKRSMLRKLHLAEKFFSKV